MKAVARVLALAACAAFIAGQAYAQTADEVIEKHLAASGGRAALSKLQTRVSTGTIAVSVQGADIAGPIQIWNKAPNKARTRFTLDLTQFGGQEMVVDQVFDGKTGFASNSMQGDREITGNQLENMRNSHFPTELLNYKDDGMTVELKGKEKLDTKDVFVLQFTPKTGSPSTQYFDAETYMVVRSVTKIDIPELGGMTEQTTDLADYRKVDGIMLPFSVKIVNAAQLISIALEKVEHGKPIEDDMFSRAVK